MRVADPRHIVGGTSAWPRLEDARFFYDQDQAAPGVAGP
jgi:glycyl-tRNA synthetase beta subunit